MNEKKENKDSAGYKLGELMQEALDKGRVIEKKDGNLYLKGVGGDTRITKKVITPEEKRKERNPFHKISQAEEFIEKNPLFYNDSGMFWKWDKENKKYEVTDEINILNTIEEELGLDIISSKARTEIINSLKQVGRKFIPENSKPTWVQFKNKIVDVITGEEIEPSPKYFITNPIPYELRDTWETPVMDRIFEEWVGKDYVQTLYEILAYCLLPDYPIHRVFCFIGGGMNGKCQKGEDLVLMENGKWKMIKDIKIGEKIISPQKDGSSKFTKVINVHKRFEKEVYDVYEKTRKKRLLYTCAGNHLIPIIRNWTKRTSMDDSTPRIMERKLFEYDAKHISKLNNDKSQICSFTTTAINYKQKDEIINPYCLGAWLGDGHFSIRKIREKCSDTRRYKLNNGKYVLGKCLGITSMDDEIMDEFYKNYPKDMRGISKKTNNLASTYRMKVNGKFAKQLTRFGLQGKNSGNKFIPKKCLLSSIDYRKDLLAGLIDTDGFVQKKTGAIYYTTKSKQLSEDIKDLVFSLGGYSNIRNVKKKSQNGTEGNYFELSIQFQNYDIPLRLNRKKERLFNKRYSPRNVAIECIKTKPQQVYGIEIEGDSKWYITNNWMVTHNSKYLDLLKKFIGKENVCSTELDVLIKSRFEVTRLYKKLACQMGETDFNEMGKTSILKKLSGGDLIGFEYKNKTPFEANNYAKIIIATNNLPTTTDKTIGFYRRWMIIDFPNQFTEKKDILAEIPEEEYNNLTRKCFVLLMDLLTGREFHKEGTIEERKEKYESKSNFLQEFINHFTNENSNEYITKADFFKKFSSWSKENRHREMSETSIGKSMKKMGYTFRMQYFKWMFDGKGGNARVWDGLSWND